ncbi:SdrD B-like domain-containing protein [Microbacterium sp. NPDC055903]
MKKFLAATTSVAAIAALSIAYAPAAMAAPGDGTITVTVVNDRNVNSTRDAADLPLNNVQVRITDSSGHTVTRNTNATGQIVLAAGDAGNTLVGGKYRIDVANPSTGTYTEAPILDGHADPQFAPATSFVDVLDGEAAAVSVGYVDVSTLGPENAQIFSAIQPDSIWPGASENKEIYTVPYRLDEAVSPVTTRVTTGSVYGIGLDQDAQKIYAGAYAKRGSTYGSGGPGAIYRVDPWTGATEVYATVADVGTTEHDMTSTNASGHETQDYDFRTAVGRESLGDVEVTDDSRFLLAVNMHTDSIVVYPIQSGVDPAPLQTLPIPAVGECAADWAPMAIEQHDGKIYIGATCGATSEASVIEYDLSAEGILTPTGVVLTGDPTTAPGHSGVHSGNIPTAAECEDVDWMPWRDDVPQPCIDNSAAVTPPDPAGQGLARQFSVPQPMLSDLAFTEEGGLVLAFRDRGGDQYSSMLYYGARTSGLAAYSNYIATGDIVAVCVDGSTMDFDCRADFNDFGGFHNEAAFGGMVYVEGTDRLVINQMDATELWSNGLRAFNPATGAKAAGATGTADRLVTNDFQKAQGLADMEALVRETVQQIGNRIWLDDDEDGLQDPNEPAVGGVQVSLYTAAGEFVATTETDENGEYYFDTTDGLLPGTQYQVRLDRADDFEAGGPLAGTTVTINGAGNTSANDGYDNNGFAATVGTDQVIVANVTTPADYRNDHSIDFGFIPAKVSIGDYVWLDADRDGQQDAGEAPVPGATVRLLDADGNEVDSTTTDANGYYSFTDLRASSDYTVVFPMTVTVDGAVYALTSPEQGDAASDSNPAVATGEAPVRTPADGDNLGTPGDADDPTIDAGYVAVVSVGDYLWIDEDEDGVQDAGEPVVPAGTEVRLLTPEGDEVATAVTDENGYYVFPNLPGGTDYIIEFPTSVTVDGIEHPLTTPNQGDDDAADSDPDPSNGRVEITTPESGQNSTEPGEADDPTIDAGYTPNVVSIGDYLWIDEDRDGVQDDSEVPVGGATVNLLSADGETVIATTTTDEDGYYFFANLPASTDFLVEFPTTVTVDGIVYSLTEPSAGDDNAEDSNADQATGRAPVTTPAEGDNLTGPGQTDDPTIDAGYIAPLVSIGDYVWIDTDRDGQQDEGEVPVPGATVNLLSADGETVIDTVETDENGYYVFTDLPPGVDYIVEFPTEVTVDGVVHVLTAPGQGAGATDSNPAIATGHAPVTTPLSGNNSAEPGEADDPTIDAGFVPVLVSIGDYLWIDEDRDGIQDEGETPVSGATVTLLTPEGDVVATTTTDENGYYVFPNLINSTDYVVEFPLTVTFDDRDYSLTQPGAGDDDAADSNADVVTGRAPVTTPATGNNSTEPGQADDPTIDAGYVAPLVSIGDYVWIDTDRDGVQDAAEAPIPGVTVTLLTPEGDVVATTETDENGYYVFPNLPTSTDYIVEFPTSVEINGVEITLTTPNRGDADGADSDADPATGQVRVTTPASGSNSTEPGEADDPTIDAGYLPSLVSVGDYVWIDKDGDGVQDAGEKPLAGIEVKLFDKDGNLVETTKTDKDGYYSFTDLLPGTEYQIEFPTTVTIDGVTYDLTRSNQGDDDDRDSDVDPKTGRVVFTTPLSGSNSGLPGEADGPDIDAGFVPQSPLALTGAVVPWLIVAAAMTMLLVGGALVLRRRQTA